jgi:hypothetical protein
MMHPLRDAFPDVSGPRIALGTAGLALAGFGVFRLITQIAPAKLAALLAWLGGAVVLHDAVVAPLVVGSGWLLSRYLPARPRRYAQWTLIVAALVGVVALPLIARQGTQPRAKALLLQSYGLHLVWVLVSLFAGGLLLYLTDAAARGRRRRPRG